jgi:hypothetical protein
MNVNLARNENAISESGEDIKNLFHSQKEVAKRVSMRTTHHGTIAIHFQLFYIHDYCDYFTPFSVLSHKQHLAFANLNWST